MQLVRKGTEVRNVQFEYMSVCIIRAFYSFTHHRDFLSVQIQTRLSVSITRGQHNLPVNQMSDCEYQTLKWT